MKKFLIPIILLSCAGAFAQDPPNAPAAPSVPAGTVAREESHKVPPAGQNLPNAPAAAPSVPAGTVAREEPHKVPQSGQNSPNAAAAVSQAAPDTVAGQKLADTAITHVKPDTAVITELPAAAPAPELPKIYTLTVYANIANGGTVSRNPNYSAYYAGTQVILTATPNAGHAFDGWSGAASARDSSIIITVNDNITLTANFRLLPPPPPPPPVPVAQPTPPPPSAPTPAPTPATAAPTAGPPNIAVYVTGGASDDEKSALGTRILASLVNSGRYKGIERSNTFLAEIDKEMEKQMSGAIDDNQISKVGKQFGVKFICIVDITPAYESFQVSARIVNVETAEVVYIGEAFCPYKTALYITWVSEQVVRKMFGEKLLPEPHDPSRIRISAGAGVFMPRDFGGGASWGNGERVAMPYGGFGAYLFADAMYAEVFFGYSSGGGEWESDNTYPDRLPEMERSYLHAGIIVKYPFGVGAVKLSPLIGLDYDLSIGGTIKNADKDNYVFNGKNERLSSNALSAMWVRIGGGLDFDVSRRVYLRSEFLYGMRTANDWEHDAASDGSGQTMTGHGFTLKAGVGIRFAELKF